MNNENDEADAILRKRDGKWQTNYRVNETNFWTLHLISQLN